MRIIPPAGTLTLTAASAEKNCRTGSRKQLKTVISSVLPASFAITAVSYAVALKMSSSGQSASMTFCAYKTVIRRRLSSLSVRMAV